MLWRKLNKGKESNRVMIRTLIIGVFLLSALLGAGYHGELYAMENTVVVLETTQGVIELTLRPDIAPKACENFVKLVEKGYYNGIIFHRVIPEFMIQGGDPTGTGAGGSSIWERPFGDETQADVCFDKPGILAMANSGPNTNGSQFFITTVETSWLNMRHTIFGYVSAGYDVVRKIEDVPTGAGNKPLEPQEIIKAYIKTGK